MRLELNICIKTRGPTSIVHDTMFSSGTSCCPTPSPSGGSSTPAIPSSANQDGRGSSRKTSPSHGSS